MGLVTTNSRVLAGVAVNALGRFWVLAIQLAAVPVLVKAWGADTYGVWLMLSAIPTYIALSDFGFGSAAAVEITRHVQAGDRPAALKSFQSVWLLITSATVGLFAILAVLYGLSVSGLAPFLQTSRPEIASSGLAMALSAVLIGQLGLLHAAYRSTGHYALGTFLLEIQLPLEAAAIFTAAILGGGLLQAALAAVAVRALGLVVYIHVLRRVEPWIVVGAGRAQWIELRRLRRPAFASMGLSISQAVSIQGVLLALGVFVSPTTAAAFGTARTLVRAPLQLIGLVTGAIFPELAAAEARGDRMLSARLMAANLLAMPLVVVPASIGLIWLGPEGVRLLSHGELAVSREAFVWFSVMLALGGAWSVLAQPSLATNRHHRIASAYTVLCLAFAASPALPLSWPMVERTAAFACVAELGMLGLCLAEWRKSAASRSFRVVTAPAMVLSWLKLRIGQANP
jgi:O-antigen/teichoic acid export membrane protein